MKCRWRNILGNEIHWLSSTLCKIKKIFTHKISLNIPCMCLCSFCMLCVSGTFKRMKTETRIVWAVCGVCVFSFLVFTRMKVKLLKSSINYFTPIGWPPVLAKSGVSLMVKICHNESRLFWIAPDRICGLNHS